MADINGYLVASISKRGNITVSSPTTYNVRFPSTNYEYQMEGVGASTPGTCSWVAQGAPDFAASTPAAAAAIAAAGLTTPLRFVRVVSTWPLL